jgi:biotin-[acetyl-CoA-carboxylase] ligase BirA-like protein
MPQIFQCFLILDMFKFIHLKKCQSTNDEAYSLISKLGKPTLVLSDEQSSGRGRHGKVWSSSNENKPPSLTTSLALFFEENKISYANWIPLIAGISAYQALHQGLLTENDSKNLFLKWPNDLWVYDKKLSGILCETKILEPNHRILIVGWGCNLHIAPNLNEVKTTSVFDLDRLKNLTLNRLENETLRVELAHSFANFFLNYYNELPSNTLIIKNTWKSFAKFHLNMNFKLSSSQKIIKPIDLNDNGSLLAEDIKTKEQMNLDQPEIENVLF